MHVWDSLRYKSRRVFTPALRDVYRRLRGICGRDGMACGAIYAARTARGDHWLHTGFCLDWRTADQRRLLSRRDLQPAPAADSRRTRSLALHGDVWAGPGHSSDRATAISSGIANLEAKESRGDAQASELCRAFPSDISQNRADYLPDDGLLLRGIVWDAAAFRPNYSRHAGSTDPARGGARTTHRLSAGHAGDGRAGRTHPDGFSGGAHFEPQ